MENKCEMEDQLEKKHLLLRKVLAEVTEVHKKIYKNFNLPTENYKLSKFRFIIWLHLWQSTRISIVQAQLTKQEDSVTVFLFSKVKIFCAN